MNILIELALPFARQGGRAVCFKGPALAGELAGAERALFELAGKVEEIREFSLPWGERSLAVIKKTAKTPKKYPRQAGKAAKEPIC